MKQNINIQNLLKIAALSAYIFTHAVSANTNGQLSQGINDAAQNPLIMEEIALGFNALLADIGFPAVHPAVAKSLELSATETQASKMIQAGTQQLPEYKFKVVITE